MGAEESTESLFPYNLDDGESNLCGHPGYLCDGPLSYHRDEPTEDQKWFCL
jgi:hypothetical protein